MARERQARIGNGSSTSKSGFPGQQNRSGRATSGNNFLKAEDKSAQKKRGRRKKKGKNSNKTVKATRGKTKTKNSPTQGIGRSIKKRFNEKGISAGITVRRGGGESRYQKYRRKKITGCGGSAP